ncbi:hypothetical protein NGR_c19140 [Sinorhizobium fredii NGR234]|uniref:Lectin-like protein BA14k n=1 Tax=Sinorhizobium fredii (strain NBRC 101917 / NGR234) TaxID=394 RepID=C3ME09_SINFN|nr:BA14K family protein [Sinorhizobium fredii]ACP25678.1 hypothetical protein NGR_c19140 [Sinorhizobium fredii NGR234]
MKRLAIIALSLATAMSSVPPPAGAFPTMPTVKSETADVQRVQFSYERGEQFKGSGCRYPCVRGRDYRRGHYSNRYYRNGYRRHHYRHYDDDDDDFGALFGGLAAGAIIGGLLAQPRYYSGPRYYAGGNPHVRWCYGRYRSYRAYDNTYQPYYGPRRLCVSPYL